jgi:hypothetical protein
VAEGDEDPFEHLRLVGVQNREQVIKLLEERIGNFEAHMGAYPGPYDPLNGTRYIVWERKAMLWLGKVAERLQVYQELSVLPPEQAARLKIRALAVINRATSQIIMGNRS